MSGSTATIGRRPSIRAVRAMRTTWTSVQAIYTGTAAVGTAAGLFVPFQNNKKRVALPSAVAKRQNRGDARRQPGIPNKHGRKAGQGQEDNRPGLDPL